MTLPASVASALRDACASPVVEVSATGGGDINDAFAVRLGDRRRLFVKTRRGAFPGEYAAEAAGLRWLAYPAPGTGGSGALQVPRVVLVGDDAGDEAVRFLALEWIDAGALDRAGEEELGRGLAAIHAAGAPRFGAGPPRSDARGAGAEDPPLRIGRLQLTNEPCEDWPSFYVRRRLEPLVALARRAGALSVDGERAVYAVCERIHELAGPPEPVARLHGDLWVGNVLADRAGHPHLIDPAAYGGHREIDLAMLRLFGSGSSVERVVSAYEEVSPLAAGHERRVALWQLLPLLVHAVLFGGSYGAAAHSAARRALDGGG